MESITVANDPGFTVRYFLSAHKVMVRCIHEDCIDSAERLSTKALSCLKLTIQYYVYYFHFRNLARSSHEAAVDPRVLSVR